MVIPAEGNSIGASYSSRSQATKLKTNRGEMASIKAAMAMALMAMVVGIVMMGNGSEGAVTCGAVTSSLAACRPYLVGSMPAPSPACCTGVKNLNTMASSPPDRQAACNCLKSLAASVKPNPANAQSLPGKCGVNVGVPISTTVNCNAIH